VDGCVAHRRAVLQAYVVRRKLDQRLGDDRLVLPIGLGLAIIAWTSAAETIVLDAAGDGACWAKTGPQERAKRDR